MHRMFGGDLLNPHFKGIGTQIDWEIWTIWRLTVFHHRLGLALDMETVLIEWQSGNPIAIYKGSSISSGHW